MDKIVTIRESELNELKLKAKWWNLIAEEMEYSAKMDFPKINYWVETGSRFNVILNILYAYRRAKKPIHKKLFSWRKK